MLHIHRFGLDLSLRATGDAGFEAIEWRGLTAKVFGNRWERQLDERGVAAVDLLVPADRSRARDTVKVDDVVTTEVRGLAEALRRPRTHGLFRLHRAVRSDRGLNLGDTYQDASMKKSRVRS